MQDTTGVLRFTYIGISVATYFPTGPRATNTKREYPLIGNCRSVQCSVVIPFVLRRSVGLWLIIAAWVAVDGYKPWTVLRQVDHKTTYYYP